MIHMTYTGSCVIDGITVMCSSMNSVLEQKPLFYDHILGLRDKLTKTGNVTTKGPSDADGLLNVQKRTYRYSPGLAKASISGPVPSEGFQRILNKAVHGDEINVVMTFYKTDAPQVTVSKAIIASLSIDVKAGEVVSFSMEIVGASYIFSEGQASVMAECAKLLTWDRCIISATPITHGISSFSISINNPPIPIYTTKWTQDVESNGMMPQKIRIGIQEVTGSIGVYGADPIDAPSTGTVSFDLNGSGKKIQALFVQPKDDASTGQYIRTVTFTGVSDSTIWEDL